LHNDEKGRANDGSAFYAIYCGGNVWRINSDFCCHLFILPASDALQKKCAMNFGWLTSIAVDT
jgi:hypothetical protein